jgi:4-hydroxy-4-methyl-2-oxoglutarate aldolase
VSAPAQAGSGIDAGWDAAELLRLGSATLYEASGLDCYLDAGFRPAWPGAAMVGRALPVLAAEGDNLAIHYALAAASPGDILVVDGGGGEFGYWGEVMSVAAQASGVCGLIIDGGVRDTMRLEALGFPAFSSSISIRGTSKAWLGVVGQPITLRGRPIRRGDLVVADRDGVAVLPVAAVEATIAEARRRANKEELFMKRLRDGELTLDIYGFRAIGASNLESDND